MAITSAYLTRMQKDFAALSENSQISPSGLEQKFQPTQNEELTGDPEIAKVRDFLTRQKDAASKGVGYNVAGAKTYVDKLVQGHQMTNYFSRVMPDLFKVDSMTPGDASKILAPTEAEEKAGLVLSQNIEELRGYITDRSAVGGDLDVVAVRERLDMYRRQLVNP